MEVESAVDAPISAASTIAISFEKPAVTTTPAPAPEPEVAVQEAAPAPVAQTVAAPKVTAKVATAAATAAPAGQVSASGKGAAILSAAYAQLGVHQDCTMLVTNALAAVGIHFHDWPAGYLSLGDTVPASQAQPGDLIYYADGGGGMAHIAVYAGNGMAVHGGFNGNDTVVFSANVGSGPVFIRVR
jgi:peptidoglycan DL-endopeptidase CwlO